MILISACLAGVPFRMDGCSKPCPALAELALQGRAVLVCPEVLGGLPTPRIPSERLADGRVVNAIGEDVTAQFRLGAQRALQICRDRGCTRAVLKARSPSCGTGMIYDGSFSKRLVAGNGVFAQLLQAEGIEVLTEEEYQKQLDREEA